MGFFPIKRKNKKPKNKIEVQTAPRGLSGSLFASSGLSPQSAAQRREYEELKKAIPVIDAAICKIIRLLGTFSVKAENEKSQRYADDFIKGVAINGSSTGIEGFIYSYMDSLLTYGEAVGEMVLSPDGRRIAALYNAGLDDVEIRAGASPLEIIVYRKDAGGSKPAPYQNLIVATLLNSKDGTVRGTPLLSGLSFVSSILYEIFKSVKANWKRVGNLRFAVTYNPSDGTVFTEDDAKLIAEEWGKVMRSDSVCDFVSVGDVSVKVIGAENKLPDCETPVKHILEQILSKLGIPPFMLGFSWSSTERMSEQQADIMTSELEYYRNTLTPVITKIISTALVLAGLDSRFEIEWDDINLQDTVELSQARLNNAQAEETELAIYEKKKDLGLLEDYE